MGLLQSSASSAAPAAPAVAPPFWEIIELSANVPVKGGSASVTAFHLPLLTSIEAPPGSVLVCDGERRDLASAFVTTPFLQSSDVVRRFVGSLTPAQVEAMPAFLDWLHYTDVTIELPEGCGVETVVVRGLNQIIPGVQKYSKFPQYAYC